MIDKQDTLSADLRSQIVRATCGGSYCSLLKFKIGKNKYYTTNIK